MSEAMATPQGLKLPPGVTIVGDRETSRTSGNGAVEQGIVYTLETPNGTQTSIFIPYRIIGNTDAVAMAFNERIAQLNAVRALQS